MNYIDTLNDELKEYMMILCDHQFPFFLYKHINSNFLQRLRGVGQLCGNDYPEITIIKPKYWFSVLDHSIATACIVWKHTKDVKQTLAALYHDSGKPAFAHIVDFLLDDYENQESAEKDIYTVLKDVFEVQALLACDGLTIEDICDVTKFTILENNRPKLCADRLDGVLHTGLIWARYWQLNDIKTICNDMTIFSNENSELELGFKNLNIAEKFYEGVHHYSIILQQNEDKFVMEFIADILKLAINYKIISFDDLYVYSEAEIIYLIKNSSHSDIRDCWDKLEHLDGIFRSDTPVEDCYFKKIDAKKRHTIPLCRHENKIGRITEKGMSLYAKELYEHYGNYKDTEYAYIDFKNEAIKKKIKLNIC